MQHNAIHFPEPYVVRGHVIDCVNFNAFLLVSGASAQVPEWIWLNTSLGVGLLTSSCIFFVCLAQFCVRVTLRKGCSPRDEAEIQETTPILRVDKAKPSYETPGEPEAWKYTVLKHV